MTLYACGGPLQRSYSESSWKKDVLKMKAAKSVSLQESILLQEYIENMQFLRRKIPEIRYQDLLLYAKRDHLRYETMHAPLRRLIQTHVLEKAFGKFALGRAFITFCVRIQNLSDKDITHVRGELTFRTKKGVFVHSVPMTFEDRLASQQSVDHFFGTPYLSSDAFNTLKGLPLSALKLYWYPKHIQFTDGTTLDI